MSPRGIFASINSSEMRLETVAITRQRKVRIPFIKNRFAGRGGPSPEDNSLGGSPWVKYAPRHHDPSVPATSVEKVPLSVPERAVGFDPGGNPGDRIASRPFIGRLLIRSSERFPFILRPLLCSGPVVWGFAPTRRGFFSRLILGPSPSPDQGMPVGRSITRPRSSELDRATNPLIARRSG